MSFLEGLAAALSQWSPLRVISDWMHEKTLREKNGYQADIERRKIELEKERVELERHKLAAGQEESMRLALLEKARIEIADEQHQRNYRLDILKLLINEGHLSRSALKDIVTPLIEDKFRAESGTLGREHFPVVTKSSSLSI